MNSRSVSHHDLNGVCPAILEDGQDLAVERRAVDNQRPDASAYPFWVLYLDLVDGVPKASRDAKLLPISGDARIDSQPIICRSDPDDVLGRRLVAPRRRAAEPAVARQSKLWMFVTVVVKWGSTRLQLLTPGQTKNS